MINLKNYIIESILDIEDNIDNMDESIKDQINQFLKDNFKTNSTYQISKKPNKDGKFEVSSNGSIRIKNKHITSLTNGLFIWINIKDYFYCTNCNSLKSLEGAPKEVGGDFICFNCKSLTSLEGAPKEVGGNFDCGYCDSLTSLEGAPKEVRGDFYCYHCKGEFTKEDVKKVSNVKGTIDV